MVEKIDYASTLDMEDILYIDTRAPVEFEKDHVPRAVNIPIFDNEERAMIGTMYKQVSQELAVEKGLDIYKKKIDDFRVRLMEFRAKTLIIYCWRGGMRSKAITELAEGIGLSCNQLSGGYKSYRKHVREQLENFRLKPGLIVLHGLTGSGKTDILQEFDDKIDLEGLAQHRSSVFGAIGLVPRTQKMFESLLLQELKRLESRKNIVIEGESRKIGNIIMPEFLYLAMNKGINILVQCSQESRVRRLSSIYTGSPKSTMDVRDTARSLRKKLGKKTVFELMKHLENDEIAEFMQAILDKYYDPLYTHSIGELDYDYSLDSDDIIIAAGKLREKYRLR